MTSKKKVPPEVETAREPVAKDEFEARRRREVLRIEAWCEEDGVDAAAWQTYWEKEDN